MKAQDKPEIGVSEEDLALTANELRYARPTDLAKLSGYDTSTWSEWTNLRSMGEFQEVRVAKELRMSLEEFRKGYKLRQEDAKRSRETKLRIKDLIEAKNAS
jgi:hypothetical protein